MVHRFGAYELDEAQRELRLQGRELALQPKVFDLLLYLVRNRDRVVSKEELLDTLWADVIVADGALQRAMSLVRTALRPGGSRESIRTFARHGYRFCALVAGDEAAARGWHNRAASYLAGLEEGREHGLLEWLGSRMAAVDGNLPEALRGARRTVALGRQLPDPDLEVLGLLYEGLWRLAQGDVQAG